MKIFKIRTNKTDYYNSQEFYNRRPDLAPRNIYLSMGRVIDKKTIDRNIGNFGEPFWVRVKNLLKYKVEDIFKR